jgi:DNA-directed RNA polymerase specialized sigma24 family protein
MMPHRHDQLVEHCLAAIFPLGVMLLMRHRFGWTLQQIGAALGITPGAVAGRLRRLVGGLRRAAQEESDD